jgi:hypothetical protein
LSYFSDLKKLNSKSDYGLGFIIHCHIPEKGILSLDTFIYSMILYMRPEGYLGFRDRDTVISVQIYAMIVCKSFLQPKNVDTAKITHLTNVNIHVNKLFGRSVVVKAINRGWNSASTFCKPRKSCLYVITSSVL